jgi:hypothetical protein
MLKNRFLIYIAYIFVYTSSDMRYNEFFCFYHITKYILKLFLNAPFFFWLYFFLLALLVPHILATNHLNGEREPDCLVRPLSVHELYREMTDPSPVSQCVLDILMFFPPTSSTSKMSCKHSSFLGIAAWDVESGVATARLKSGQTVKLRRGEDTYTHYYPQGIEEHGCLLM